MTAFTSRTLARHASLWDLAAIWVTLTATFAYLEVPLVNAPLFATALVLQAALGTVVITRLLKGAQPSLLMLLGPGLILGGALSFAIFQVVGRGLFGIVVTVLAGLTSVSRLTPALNIDLKSESRWWMISQLVGMGTIAVVPEFTELLPAAIGLFAIGYIADPARGHNRSLLFICGLLSFILALGAYVARSENWWVVTDDYLFLEVIAQHLTASGPLADWGVSNFARYHWLSYGWSGLLDLLGGGPEPLVTLTRVMPITYALSLASSLALSSRLLIQRSLSFGLLTPLWAIVALGRFEWTGTSTGGVYSVLAAAIAIGLTAFNCRAKFHSWVLFATLLSLIVGLTKLPGLFAVALASWCALTLTMAHRVTNKFRRRVVFIVMLALTIPVMFASIELFGSVFDRVAIVRVNPGLGQLSEFSRSFVIGVLVANQPWLWIIVGILAVKVHRLWEHARPIDVWLSTASFLALLAGLSLELTVSGPTNTYSYFSGPMYFIAALSFVHAGSVDRRPNHERVSSQHFVSLMTVLFILFGLFWDSRAFEKLVWEPLFSYAPEHRTLQLELLRFFTNNPVTGASLILLSAIGLLGVRKNLNSVVDSFLLSAVLLIFFSMWSVSIDDLRREVKPEVMSQQIGSVPSRVVGEWLRKHTNRDDLIATNHLYEDRTVTEIALAVWSQREFLILGPQIGYEISRRSEAAKQLSRSFINEPSADGCSHMRGLDVKWFVNDKDLTATTVLPPCATETFRFENFSVLSLNY